MPWHRSSPTCRSPSRVSNEATSVEVLLDASRALITNCGPRRFLRFIICFIPLALLVSNVALYHQFNSAAAPRPIKFGTPTWLSPSIRLQSTHGTHTVQLQSQADTADATRNPHATPSAHATPLGDTKPRPHAPPSGHPPPMQQVFTGNVSNASVPVLVPSRSSTNLELAALYKGRTEDLPVWWFAPFFDRSSFGKEAATTVLGMIRSGVVNESNLWVGATEGSCAHRFDDSMPYADYVQLDAAWRRPSKSAPAIVICHSLPPHWARPKSLWKSCDPCPPPGYTSALAVGRAMAETDIYNAQFVNLSNTMDEVWVPSKFSKDVLTASGVEPSKIRIVPIAVNTTLYDPASTAPVKLPLGDLVFGNNRRFQLPDYHDPPPPAPPSPPRPPQFPPRPPSPPGEPDMPNEPAEPPEEPDGPPEAYDWQGYIANARAQVSEQVLQDMLPALQLQDPFNEDEGSIAAFLEQQETNFRKGLPYVPAPPQTPAEGAPPPPPPPPPAMADMLDWPPSSPSPPRPPSPPPPPPSKTLVTSALAQIAIGLRHNSHLARGNRQLMAGGRSNFLRAGSDPTVITELLAQPQRRPNRKPFIFISTFKWEKRKGWDTLLQAYLQEFTDEDSVELYIITKKFMDSGDFKRDMYRHAEEVLGMDSPNKRATAAPLYVISTTLSPQQYSGMYRAADCYVIPTRGEGWGMPITEAMSMGLPAIVTNWSGTTDFVDDSIGYLVNYTLSKVPDTEPYWFRGARWADVDAQHLRKVMRHVYEHPQEAAMKGRAARQLMSTKYSPEIVAGLVGVELKRINDDIRAGTCSKCFNETYVDKRLAQQRLAAVDFDDLERSRKDRMTHPLVHFEGVTDEIRQRHAGLT